MSELLGSTRNVAFPAAFLTLIFSFHREETADQTSAVRSSGRRIQSCRFVSTGGILHSAHFYQLFPEFVFLYILKIKDEFSTWFRLISAYWSGRGQSHDCGVFVVTLTGL